PALERSQREVHLHLADLFDRDELRVRLALALALAALLDLIDEPCECDDVGVTPFSILRQERHAPQPPTTRGSAVQFSVCASRSATVCLPIDRGPLSSYAWATSPRTACAPSFSRRRRCPITSRIGSA